MKHQLHIAAATLALLTILAFLLSTIVSELFLSYEAVAAVEHTIVYALIALMPLLIMTAGSGHRRRLSATPRGRAAKC